MNQENIQQKLNDIENAMAAGFAKCFENDQRLLDFVGAKLAVLGARQAQMDANINALLDLEKLIIDQLEGPPPAVSGVRKLGSPEPQ